MAAHAGADLYRSQAYLREKVRRADFTSACVRGNAEMLRVLGGSGVRVEWIYHGVDLERFDGRHGPRDPQPLLLAVGRLSPPKGFDDALRALAQLRSASARLVIVGDGPERANLAALARSLGVEDRVEFTGSLHRDQVIALYRRAWLLVAPSRVLSNGRRDGIPNVVVEALAMGVPCVGTRAAGLEEAIVPGETGALADPGDAAGLAAAIDDLLADGPALETLRDRARRKVEREFDAARNFERLAELFGVGRATREPVIEEASA
jgi:glycosyltransferase involved in cell wall biosynthesis